MSVSLADLPDIWYSPAFYEGFLCGVYSGIFALYLQCHASTEGPDNTKKIVFYALCVLYVLSVIVFALDFVALTVISFQPSFQYLIGTVRAVVFGCCDFIAQSILIYRCWIVWGRKIRVVIIPSILALAYLGMWMAAGGAVYIVEDSIQSALWGTDMTVICVAISMVVNALVTGLIAYRIFKVFRGVQHPTSTEKSLGITGGRKLRSLIFVIIESGMVLFSIQLVRVILSLLPESESIDDTLSFILATHQMVNGITPTIILVRVIMGLSFDDKRSLEEATGSLHFASDSPTSISEMESPLGVERHDLDGSKDVQAMESIGSTVQSNQITGGRW